MLQKIFSKQSLARQTEGQVETVIPVLDPPPTPHNFVTQGTKKQKQKKAKKMLHQQLLTWRFKEVDLHAAERHSRFEVVSDSRFLLAEDLGHL